VIDSQRLYEYRFAGIDQSSRETVWREIGAYVYDVLGRPDCVLDPAAGRCEFISAIPARERWAVDEVAYAEAVADDGLTVVTSDVMTADLPAGHFGGVWVSNFLEHLPDQNAVAAFLRRMHDVTRPGGRIAVMGPNFRYAARQYFDCADHNVVLTHVAVAEHLHAAGFRVSRVTPRFLPYSFRGSLPASARLTRAYLRMPLAWRLLGRQFLVVAEKNER
jgi:SAM-dependent methyltransferase